MSCHSFVHTWHSGIPDPPAAAGVPEANGHAHENSSGAAEVKGDVEPKSSQEWVEVLVQQMAGAKDLDDARSRASQLLQAFEQAVLQQAAQARTLLQPVTPCCRTLMGSALSDTCRHTSACVHHSFLDSQRKH